MRVGNELTELVEIKRGAREVCVLSQDPITLCRELLMREIEIMDGFSNRGRNVTNIRYADDTVLVVVMAEKLQTLLTAVNVASEEKGLRINKEKTDCMVV